MTYSIVWLPPKSLPVFRTLWKPLLDCHRIVFWLEEPTQYRFRWPYRERDSAMVSPLQGQTSLVLKSCLRGHLAAWWLCLPGVRCLLRFFERHNLSLCQASPCCSERLQARTEPAGVNCEAVEGYSAFCSGTVHTCFSWSAWELMGVNPAYFWATLELKMDFRWHWDLTIPSKMISKLSNLFIILQLKKNCVWFIYLFYIYWVPTICHIGNNKYEKNETVLCNR